MKFRIALDTNVLFSGLFFGGIPGSVIELVNHKQADLCLSEYLRDEFLSVVKAKGLPADSFSNLLAVGNVRIISDQDYDGEENFSQARRLCRDAKDVPILAFALHAFRNNWLDYLVTGDSDLHAPAVATAAKNRVVLPSEFLRLYEDSRS